MKLSITNISDKAMTYLIKYNWPGNIRDLQNAIQSEMILAKEGSISEGHHPMRIKGYDKESQLEPEQ